MAQKLAEHERAWRDVFRVFLAVEGDDYPSDEIFATHHARWAIGQLVKQLEVGESTVNWLIRSYLGEYRPGFVGDHDLLPVAIELLPYTSNRPLREKILALVVQGGWRHQAEQLAQDLGRKLTAEEVSRLVDKYRSGSHEEAKCLIDLVGRHVGKGAAAEAQAKIKKQDEYWANDLY